MIPLHHKILLISLLAFGQFAYTQNQPLVGFKDLSFNSEFEKQVFTGVQEGISDYLSVFCSISPTSDSTLFIKCRDQVMLDVAIIRDKKFNKLKDEKKVARIYEIVNKDILKRYKEQTLFPDIFSDGVFNCLTASACYGFLFSNLDVDFEFKESSNHVHPVAFPATLHIKVETTDPINGFKYFEPKLKVQFVNYLLNAKIISKEEANQSSIENIFNKYYFPESSIGLKELAGLQYMNDALFNFSLDNFNYAFRQIQKAYFLYPSDRVSTVMLFLLSRCLAETDYKRPEDGAFLCYASSFVGRGMSKEDFIFELKQMTEKVLFQKSQAELYYQICEYLLERISNGEIRKAVEIEYYSQKGEVYISTFHGKEALESFEKALSLDPENLDLQMVTVKCLAFSFGSASNKEIVSAVEKFEQRFQKMQSNETFIALQMQAYLQLSVEKFDFEKPEEGEVLLKKFENLYKMHSGISIQYEKVGDAYSAAAVYYFKRNNKPAARSYLNRGLSVSPDNYQLMYRLRAIE
jgi:tetratricopeptide (TPR) repeat protein